MKNFLPLLLAICLFACNSNSQNKQVKVAAAKDSVASSDGTATEAAPPSGPLDTARYNKLMKYLANGDSSGRWPVKNQPYPLAGAILPFHRLVAYYGNLYSKKMGCLGQYPKEEMLRRLMGEVKKWAKYDTTLPVIPVLHYIAVTAQGAPGKDGKYRYRMPLSQIDTVINWAKEVNGQVFVDVQLGFSSLQDELPLLEKYLAIPNVHLGIDPEFAMAKKGKKPGTVIGTLDAADVNYASNFLVNIVKKYHIPPKILIVHRFTQGMLTNYKEIKLHPEVQTVIDMDGWGNRPRKKSTYYDWINPQPVQFTGFKLFYKNDTQYVGDKQEMQPDEVTRLKPIPIYIQYQ